MFDVSWTEILVVAVIAIIVVGPKELPGMLRAFGKTFGQVKRTAREFQNTFNDALREAERQANLDDMRKDLDEVRSIDPTKSLRKGLSETKRQLSGKVGDAAPPKPDVVPLKAAEKSEGPANTIAPPGATEPVPDGSRTAPADAGADGGAPRAVAAGERR